MTKDQIMGSIMAGMIGDAAGACFEFAPPGNHVVPADIPQYCSTKSGQMNVFGLPAGTITDDGIQMMCFMEAWLENHGRSADVIVEAFKLKLLSWIELGYWTPRLECFDVGSQTIRALQDGEKDSENQGNGSIMRLAPISAVDDRDIFIYCNNLTHPGSLNLYTAITMEEILRSADDHDKVSELIARFERNIDYSKVSGGSGWAPSSLIQATNRILLGESLESGIAGIINSGGDTDTIACIFGQIWGAAHGFTKISRDCYIHMWRIRDILNTSRRFTLSLFPDTTTTSSSQL